MPTSTNTTVRNLRAKRASLATPPPRRRKSKRPHVLPANVTGEGQWTSGPAPQVKTSRMFLGMLALHLVAVAGLVAFHFYGHDGADSAPSNLAEAAKVTVPAAVPAIKSANSSPAAPSAVSRGVPVARTAAPSPTPAPPPPVPATEHYIVRMDESWESIAGIRGISVEDLRGANPDVEFNVGRRITIPAPRRLITATTESRQAPRGLAIQPSTVPGDSYNHYVPNSQNSPQPAALTATAPAPSKAMPTTMGGPVKTNALAPSSTKTTLSGKTHTVTKGETLFGIAKRRGISEKALMKYNGITDASKLRIGQKIKLPTTD